MYPQMMEEFLNKGTAYLTDAGMCGDYNSVIGMNTENSINRFFKKESVKHFPQKVRHRFVEQLLKLIQKMVWL